MKVLYTSSLAFENNNKLIPAKYTCNGDDINPPTIEDKVTEIKSLVLIVDDPDTPSGK